MACVALIFGADAGKRFFYRRSVFQPEIGVENRAQTAQILGYASGRKSVG